jgi:hypothetical protein
MKRPPGDFVLAFGWALAYSPPQFDAVGRVACLLGGLPWSDLLASLFVGIAGWSSPVARQAHNLKAAGSNPAPATN